MGAFTFANDATLTEFIRQARRRVIFLAPAVSKSLATVLIKSWDNLGAEGVSITLDVDSDVYRLGYGDSEALTLLYETARRLGTTLNRHRGIRIGVIIADDSMMVYSPTPLLIEAGERKPDHPNAILIGSPPPLTVQDLGFGANGVKDQKIGLDVAEISRIESVKNDLEENPPQKFDIARAVRVFNAYFEFVELNLVGTAIQRKTIRIPSKLIGLAADPQTEKLLRASFQVVDTKDELSGKHLENDRVLIAKEFLKPLKGYGNAIVRTEKVAFQEQVEKLKAAVLNYRKELAGKLQAAMDRNRKTLLEALLPTVKRNPPAQWKMSDGTKLKDETLKQLLDEELILNPA